MADRKLRVGVVFGGRSGEHEVSLAGAASVMAAIDRSRFDVVPIGIDPGAGAGSSAAIRCARSARTPRGGRSAEAGSGGRDQARAARARGRARHRAPRSRGCRARRACRRAFATSLDVVLIMLHGPQGEDGTIQGLLELAGMPYIGAGVLASAVGMDKVAMKDMFRAHGLPVVDYARRARATSGGATGAGASARSPSASASRASSSPPTSARASASARSRRAEDLAAGARPGGRPRPPHPRRARGAGARGRGRGARQRRARGLAAGRGLLRGRVVRLRDQVRRRPDDLQGAGAAARPRPRSGCATSPSRRSRPIDCAGMARVDFFIETERPRARQRDQHHPGLHLDERLPAALGGLGHLLPRADHPPDRARDSSGASRLPSKGRVARRGKTQSETRGAGTRREDSAGGFV